MKYTGETFSDRTVSLDGNTFDGCKFLKATLEYSGGKPPTLLNCHLESSTISFIDQASDTISFMKSMYHGGFKSIVEHFFDNIKTANIASTPGSDTAVN